MFIYQKNQIYMKKKEILYNPDISIKDNAKANGVSEATIRNYIKINGIDRRADEKLRKINICKRFYNRNRDANKHTISKKTEISYSFIKEYWEYIIGEKSFDIFDKNKSKKRKSIEDEKYFIPHISVVRDILREVQFAENILTNNDDIGKIINKCGHPFGLLDDNISSRTCDIITIPSVTDDLKSLLSDYLKKCRNKVALLLPISFLSGTNRYKTVFSKYPLSEVLIYIEDVNREKNEVIKGSEPLSTDNYAWYVFERSHKDTPKLKWIHNDKNLLFEHGDTRETKILNNIVFKPTDWFEFPIQDVIQFHSDALLENRVMSNHFECIILFRGYEFLSVEQLFSTLIFSDSPAVIERYMRCKSVKQINNLDRIIGLKNADWDYKVKQYQIIAICHLYKYLTFKPYRDRLRETRGKILVECPNGKDYDFACVQDLKSNMLIGSNCSGRTTMAVRDMMLSLEDKALDDARIYKGCELTVNEKEAIIQTVLDNVRAKFDNDENVKKISDKLIKFLEDKKIPQKRDVKCKKVKEVKIDKNSKCLILNFDNTLFDTSIDDKFRKAKGDRNWKKIYSLIPKYKLYDGWKEVFEYIRENNIKVGILANAKSSFMLDTANHFGLNIDAVVGFDPYKAKPHPILGNEIMNKLNVRESQILYVGNTLDDEIQARSNMMKFVGAVWDSDDEKELREKCDVIENPLEIIPLLEGLKIDK